MEQILFEYATRLLILLIIALRSLGIKFLTKKIAGSPYEQVAKKIIEWVLWAEKEFADSGMGETKRAYVLEKAAEFCKAKKIPLDADTLDRLLEDAVSLINILRSEGSKDA